MQQIETVIFDLGGVLIDWNPRYLYRKIFDSDEEMEFFLEHVCSGQWNGEQDRGRKFSDAINLKQKEYPKYKDEIHIYFSRWHKMIKGEITETVNILTSLFDNRKHRLYALTNWSDETFPYAFQNFKFLKYFEGILVSGKEKMIKPDPEIYQLMIKRFDIDAEKSIFIDDSKNNVNTAITLGMNAIHFLSPEQLKTDLQLLKVL
jgi:2-haloacid dehalogenase